MRAVFTAFILALCVALAAAAPFDPNNIPPRPRDPPGVDADGFDHQYIETLHNVTLHMVQAGQGNKDVIVFCHGFPDSWYLWFEQMKDLAKDYHVVAWDLKGYSQSSGGVGWSMDGNHAVDADYSTDAQAHEFIHAFDQLMSQTGKQNPDFYMVSEDWGSFVCTPVASMWHQRIKGYVRGEIFTGVVSSELNPQYYLTRLCPFQIMDVFTSNYTAVLTAYQQRMYNYTQFILEHPDRMVRIVQEFNYQALPSVGWLSSFNALPGMGITNLIDMEMFHNMTFPILQLQADSDAPQPVGFFDGSICTICDDADFCHVYNCLGIPATTFFKNAHVQFIPLSGHFWPHEHPEFVTNVIRRFFTTSPYTPINPMCTGKGNLYTPNSTFCPPRDFWALYIDDPLHTNDMVSHASIADRPDGEMHCKCLPNQKFDCSYSNLKCVDQPWITPKAKEAEANLPWIDRILNRAPATGNDLSVACLIPYFNITHIKEEAIKAAETGHLWDFIKSGFEQFLILMHNYKVVYQNSNIRNPSVNGVINPCDRCVSLFQRFCQLIGGIIVLRWVFMHVFCCCCGHHKKSATIAPSSSPKGDVTVKASPRSKPASSNKAGKKHD